MEKLHKFMESSVIEGLQSNHLLLENSINFIRLSIIRKINKVDTAMLSSKFVGVNKKTYTIVGLTSQDYKIT